MSTPCTGYMTYVTTSWKTASAADKKAGYRAYMKTAANKWSSMPKAEKDTYEPSKAEKDACALKRGYRARYEKLATKTMPWCEETAKICEAKAELKAKLQRRVKIHNTIEADLKAAGLGPKYVSSGKQPPSPYILFANAEREDQG